MEEVTLWQFLGIGLKRWQLFLLVLVFTSEALNYDVRMTTPRLSFREKLGPPGKAREDEMQCEGTDRQTDS